MKKILLGTLAVVSLASISSANLQLNFPTTKLGVGPMNILENVSADAMLTVDGSDVARISANVVQSGGPGLVALIWAYDSDPAYNLEGLDGEGASLAVRDVKVRLTSDCDPPQVLTYSRGVTNQYTYSIGVPFPTSLPTSMPVFATLAPCCTINPCSITAPNGTDFGTIYDFMAHGLSFTLTNNNSGAACPNITGMITENSEFFSVSPDFYDIAAGQTATFTLTFLGLPGADDMVRYVTVTTDCGLLEFVVDDRVAANETPVVFALAEAYPNPFNPSTTLSYSVPENQVVTLNVYNTSGQLVRTLVNGMVERGEHKVVFDASDLASGVYVYTLKSATQSAMHKMVLVK